eukprot:1153792-Pelagomonas_calceolata.AAC.7
MSLQKPQHVQQVLELFGSKAREAHLLARAHAHIPCFDSHSRRMSSKAPRAGAALQVEGGVGMEAPGLVWAPTTQATTPLGQGRRQCTRVPPALRVQGG